MAKIIKTWKELVGLENDEYYLKINLGNCNGCVYRKSDDEYVAYLSTHTFYGKTYQESTVALQEFGFDVQLKNWDGETEEVSYKDQWLWNGKCEFCRRKEYCTAECKATKRRKEYTDMFASEF